MSIFFFSPGSFQALKSEEVRCYFFVIIASALMITFNVRHLFDNVWEALQQAFFQVGSIITTTGYATTDFNQWPAVSRTILVLLTFCGACAGSTGGGIKISRLLLAKSVRKELASLSASQCSKKDQNGRKSGVSRSYACHQYLYDRLSDDRGYIYLYHQF